MPTLWQIQRIAWLFILGLVISGTWSVNIHTMSMNSEFLAQQSVLTLVCADKILMSFPCSNPAGLNALGYVPERTNKATD